MLGNCSEVGRRQGGGSLARCNSTVCCCTRQARTASVFPAPPHPTHPPTPAPTQTELRLERTCNDGCSEGYCAQAVVAETLDPLAEGSHGLHRGDISSGGLLWGGGDAGAGSLPILEVVNGVAHRPVCHVEKRGVEFGLAVRDEGGTSQVFGNSKQVARPFKVLPLTCTCQNRMASQCSGSLRTDWGREYQWVKAG
jgi:hypothetical protein